MADIKIRMRYDGSDVKSGVEKSQQTLKGFGNSTSSALSGLVGKFFAVGAAATTAAAVAKKVWDEFQQGVKDGAELMDASKRLDMTTEKTQEYGYAARKGATDLQTVASTVEKLKRQMFDAAEGDEKLEKSLLRLGVSLRTIQEQDVDKALLQIGDALNNTAGSAQRTKDLYDVLGKSSGSLIVFLKELRENSEKGHFFNVSDKDLKTLKELDEIQEDLKQKLKSTRMEMTAATIDLVKFAYQFSQLKGAVDVTKKGLDDFYNGYVGGGADIQRIAEMKAKLEAKQTSKQNTKDLEEKKQGELEKQTADEKEKYDKEEQKRKEEIYLQTEKMRHQQELMRMSDEEKLKYLEEMIDKGEKQYETAKKAGKINSWDYEAQRIAVEAKGEKMSLQDKMAKEYASTHKPIDIQSDAAIGIGNFLGSSLNTKMLSLAEQTNRLLQTIEQNTRPKFTGFVQPTIFTQ